MSLWFSSCPYCWTYKPTEARIMVAVTPKTCLPTYGSLTWWVTTHELNGASSGSQATFSLHLTAESFSNHSTKSTLRTGLLFSTFTFLCGQTPQQSVNWKDGWSTSRKTLTVVVCWKNYEGTLFLFFIFDTSLKQCGGWSWNSQVRPGDIL